jgi:hypothetical protein
VIRVLVDVRQDRVGAIVDDAVGQHRRHRHDQAAQGGKHGCRDARRQGLGGSGAATGQGGEGLDEAENGAHQAHQGGDVGEGLQPGGPLGELGDDLEGGLVHGVLDVAVVDDLTVHRFLQGAGVDVGQGLLRHAVRQLPRLRHVPRADHFEDVLGEAGGVDVGFEVHRDQALNEDHQRQQTDEPDQPEEAGARIGGSRGIEQLHKGVHEVLRYPF